ncbi:hypothetical protein ANN_18469 [Periplaneta americana]|uniref:Uncharacterized protein n=1 Tax=Periplaneta americana TaxID=6978 RepID=A0ABQ8SNV6_PERAM|nr:hypothetical protein ANN_18469 [Periplaneta americana]
MKVILLARLKRIPLNRQSSVPDTPKGLKSQAFNSHPYYTQDFTRAYFWIFDCAYSYQDFEFIITGILAAKPGGSGSNPGWAHDTRGVFVNHPLSHTLYSRERILVYQSRLEQREGRVYNPLKHFNTALANYLVVLSLYCALNRTDVSEMVLQTFRDDGEGHMYQFEEQLWKNGMGRMSPTWVLARYNPTDRLDTASCTHTLLSADVHIRTDHVRYTLRYMHCFSVVSCPHPSDSALNGILICRRSKSDDHDDDDDDDDDDDVGMMEQ